jgi:hypothetical protein
MFECFSIFVVHPLKKHLFEITCGLPLHFLFGRFMFSIMCNKLMIFVTVSFTNTLIYKLIQCSNFNRRTVAGGWPSAAKTGRTVSF